MSQQEQTAAKVRDFYSVVKPDHPKADVEATLKYVLSVGEEKANVKFREKYGVDLGDYRAATLEKRVYNFLARVDPVNTDEVKNYLVGDEDAVNAVLREKFGEDLTGAAPTFPTAQVVVNAPVDPSSMLSMMQMQQMQLMQRQMAEQQAVLDAHKAQREAEEKKKKDADKFCCEDTLGPQLGMVVWGLSVIVCCPILFLAECMK